MSTPSRDTSNVLLIIGIVLGILFPVGGLVVALVLFFTHRRQQALYVALATLVGVLIGVALYL